MHIPAVRTRVKPRIPAAAKGKAPIRRRSIREPVIELTDSEPDVDIEHKFASGPSNSSSSWTIPSSSSQPRSESQTLQPKRGGSSGSLDNIPLHRRQEKMPTQLRAFPPFLESDQENEPPVQVPGPAIVPPQEPPDAPIPAPDAMRVDPVPEEVFAPVPIDGPAPVEEGKDKVSTVVAQVLEIIPDVHPDHLLALVEQHLPTHQAQVLEHVLHILFEDASYPKVEKKAKGKRKVEVEEDPAPPKKAKIDYGSIERQFQRGRYYIDLSLVSLSLLPLRSALIDRITCRTNSKLTFHTYPNRTSGANWRYTTLYTRLRTSSSPPKRRGCKRRIIKSPGRIRARLRRIRLRKGRGRLWLAMIWSLRLRGRGYWSSGRRERGV